MKKLIAGLLAGVMAASVCTFTAFASDVETVTLDFEEGSYNVEVGEEFDVNVDITENPAGFNNVTLKIEYDPSVIQAQPLSEEADSLLTYDLYGEDVPLITYSLINSRLDANVNGKKAYEAGQISIPALITDAQVIDGKQYLKSLEGTGRLFTMKFKAVGDGETSIKIECGDSSRFGEDGITKIKMNGCEADVVVGIKSEQTTIASETTTETASETTTVSSSSSSGSSSGSDATTTVSETTTIENATDETTEETTEVEDVTEETTQVVTSDERLFNDIEAYPWAISYIESLASNNIINGYSDGSFKPSNNIKRADFIIMLLRTIGEEAEAQEDGFTDVDPNAYYANAVNTAKMLGIANGNGDGTFSPSSEITRQDMMILAKRALEFVNGETISGDETVLDKFADKAEISAYAVQSLAAMVEAGFVNGTGNNIEPKANTTRAQAAVVMSKIYEAVK